MELTGEMAEEAMMVLEEIHSDIDFNKKIVTATHDFEMKIQALDLIFWHINEKEEYAPYHRLFDQVSVLITEISGYFDKIKVKEMNFLLEEEAAEKMEKVWITFHHRKIKKNLRKEKIFRKKIIKRVHQYLMRARKLFQQSRHPLSVNIDEGKIKELRANVRGMEEELKHILEKIFQFLITYEHLFKQALTQLK